MAEIALDNATAAANRANKNAYIAANNAAVAVDEGRAQTQQILDSLGRATLNQIKPEIRKAIDMIITNHVETTENVVSASQQVVNTMETAVNEHMLPSFEKSSGQMQELVALITEMRQEQRQVRERLDRLELRLDPPSTETIG